MFNEKDDYKSFMGLTPLILFVAMFLITGIVTNNFSSMPVLVGFMLVLAYSLSLNRKDKKISLEEKVEIFARSGGESTIILMVTIFILAGAFYSVANAMGSVDATVNFGLSILPSKAILPGIFLISCIISFAMGTSMGTITAIVPIAIGMSQQTGLDLSLLMGTVVGGAMFGDNLSFVSDRPRVVFFVLLHQLAFLVNKIKAFGYLNLECVFQLFLDSFQGQNNKS